MIDLWLISPAYKREEISVIVYAQRAWMLERLRERGVTCDALVIADDVNLELAAARGLRTLEHPNLPLGRKVNAGFQHALERGATHVAFVGSDSIYLPEVFTDLRRDQVTYGRWYTLAVPHRGLIVCDVPVPTWALNVYPASLLRRTKGRPCADDVDRGLDGSIRDRLKQSGGRYIERLRDADPLQTVTLRSDDAQQITSTAKLERRYSVREEKMGALRAAGYPEETCREMTRLFR